MSPFATSYPAAAMRSRAVVPAVYQLEPVLETQLFQVVKWISAIAWKFAPRARMRQAASGRVASCCRRSEDRDVVLRARRGVAASFVAREPVRGGVEDSAKRPAIGRRLGSQRSVATSRRQSFAVAAGSSDATGAGSAATRCDVPRRLYPRRRRPRARSRARAGVATRSASCVARPTRIAAIGELFGNSRDAATRTLRVRRRDPRRRSRRCSGTSRLRSATAHARGSGCSFSRMLKRLVVVRRASAGRTAGRAAEQPPSPSGYQRPPRSSRGG